MALDGSAIGRAVDRHTVKSATKLVLVTLTLLGLLVLVSFLPGVDREILGTDVTVAALAVAVVTLGVVATLLLLAPRLATVVRKALDGPRDAVVQAASAVYWLVALVAVLVAHRGLAGVGTALLGEGAWLYDLAFLLAALVSLAAVGVRVIALLNPAADAIVDRVLPNPDAAGTGNSDNLPSAAGQSTPDGEES